MLIPDLLEPCLKLVFCGTALGKKSFEEKAYYAHPGNLFWKTLANTGLTPHQIKPQNYSTLLNYNIGLTDLSKSHYGSDSELPKDAFDAPNLRNKILKFQPIILAFTSKNAAQSA